MTSELSDIVNARKYYDKDLVSKADILPSKYDIGQGKLFTGIVDSSLVAATGIFNSEIAHSFYDAITTSLPIYTSDLYNLFFPWASLAAGIGFGLAETNKQRILPGTAVVGLILYSAYNATSNLGVPSYYLLTGAAISSGVTGALITSALAPVAAIFGIGFTLSMLYKHYVKGRKYRKKKKK